MSKNIKKIVSVAAPIAGALALGPVGLGLTSAAVGGAIGGAAGGFLSGGGIKSAALGGITGYLGGGAIGAPAGASLATTTGNAALQGPTIGTGISGALTGGGVRALTAPVASSTLGQIGQTPLLNAASGIIGDQNEEAARRAAEQQAQGIQAGINANNAALRPYTELGQQATQRIGEIQADPAAYIKGNELYGSLAADAERRLLANQAAKGKVGSGGTAAALQDRLLQIGTGLVNTEIGNLQNQAGLGGNAAANVGATAYGGNTAIGNANAAGTIGGNNAQVSAYQNQLNTILATQGINKAPVYSQPISL